MILLLFSILVANSLSVELRIMTFNIWVSGRYVENGLQKIAKHILLANPDVVALQEVGEGTMKNLSLMLGNEWSYMEWNRSYPDVAILTRHNIHKHSFVNTSAAIGVKLTLNHGQFLTFICAHLDYTAYGPYAANNKMVTRMEQILAGEDERKQQLIELFKHQRIQRWMKKSEMIPMFLVGDFNAPSQLDWENQDTTGHGNWTVQWPSSSVVLQHGFVDSFRSLHPNIKEAPGHSWSTVNKLNAEWRYTVPEPQDRIDFIYFKAGKDLIKPTSSYLYAGDEPLHPIPNQWLNDYPSDHYAVISEFELFY